MGATPGLEQSALRLEWEECNGSVRPVRYLVCRKYPRIMETRLLALLVPGSMVLVLYVRLQATKCIHGDTEPAKRAKKENLNLKSSGLAD